MVQPVSITTPFLLVPCTDRVILTTEASDLPCPLPSSLAGGPCVLELELPELELGLLARTVGWNHSLDLEPLEFLWLLAGTVGWNHWLELETLEFLELLEILEILSLYSLPPHPPPPTQLQALVHKPL